MGAEMHAHAVANLIASGASPRAMLGSSGRPVAPATRNYTEIPAATQTATSQWIIGSDARVADSGLMVASDDPLSGAVLDISGPLALFHHTEVYGRGLVSLVPRLAWCDEFELTASVVGLICFRQVKALLPKPPRARSTTSGWASSCVSQSLNNLRSATRPVKFGGIG